jgi:hypothetical protein
MKIVNQDTGAIEIITSTSKQIPGLPEFDALAKTLLNNKGG